MFAIRRKDKKQFVNTGGKGLMNFTPVFFRSRAHAENHMRMKGLNPERWDIINALVFEVDENQEPIGLLTQK